MAKVLSEAAIRHYEGAGFFFPVAILGAAEVARLRDRLETFEA